MSNDQVAGTTSRHTVRQGLIVLGACVALVIATVVTLIVVGSRGPVRYDNVDELRAAFVEAGGECDEWELIPRSADDIADGLVAITCDNDRAFLGVFDTLNVEISATLAAGGRPGAAALVGANWIIGAPDYMVDRVEPHLRGDRYGTGGEE